MSRGSKVVLLVMGLGVAHASLPQAFVDPEFGFDPALFSDAGGQPAVYPLSAEPSMVITSRVILPAGAEQMYNPVTGYVQGWWKQVLDTGPAGFLAGAGTKNDVQHWVSRREPRAIYLNAQYRFFPHGTETHLEVRVTVSGVDKQWMPGLEQMIDDFLQTRLAPYVEGIHGKTSVAAVDFPGT